MRRLNTDLLGVPLLGWIAPLLSIAWPVFGAAIYGRWLAASLESLGYSPLAVAVVVETARTPNEELFLPQLILAQVRQWRDKILIRLDILEYIGLEPLQMVMLCAE